MVFSSTATRGVGATADFDLSRDRFKVRPLMMVLLVLCLVCSVQAGQGTSPDLNQLVGRTRPALAVLLSVDRRGNVTSYGTGFFIKPDGLLVTARHVSEGDKGLVALTSDGTKHPVTTFLAEDIDFDLSVLRIVGYFGPSLELGPRPLPQANDWLGLVSAQDKIAPTCTTGSVAEVVNFPGLLAVVKTTVPVRAGQSGSPLLNAAGQVVGVVPYMSFEDTVTASPLGALQALIERARTNAAVPFARRARGGSQKALLFDPDLRLAVEALQRRDRQQAESRLRAAASKFPDSAVVLTMLAAAQVEAGELRRSKATVRRALALNPNSGLLHLINACHLVAQNHLPEGLAEVRKGVELGLPDKATLVSAWALAASAEAALGNGDKAREALARLQELDPAKAAVVRDEIKPLLGSQR